MGKVTVYFEKQLGFLRDFKVSFSVGIWKYQEQTGVQLWFKKENIAFHLLVVENSGCSTDKHWAESQLYLLSSVGLLSHQHVFQCSAKYTQDIHQGFRYNVRRPRCHIAIKCGSWLWTSGETDRDNCYYINYYLSQLLLTFYTVSGSF